MKMTMRINEALLATVMKEYSINSKTEAVTVALSEMDRRAKLKDYGAKGLGFSAEALRDAVAPDYDVMAVRKGALVSHVKSRAR